MNEQNKKYIKNTNITEKQLKCVCGTEKNIVHTSNWHNGEGLFYTECPNCGRQTNIHWKSKTKQNESTSNNN